MPRPTSRFYHRHQASRTIAVDSPTFPTYQPYPETGPLRENLDVSLANLRGILSDHGRDMVYVMTSVETKDGGFLQCGCGPNFQGGEITICTCMAQMRTFRNVKPGVWMSGFTSVDATGKGNGLFHLTQIHDSAVSQYDLWNKLPLGVRMAKAAHLDPYGDVFEPTVSEKGVGSLSVCGAYIFHRWRSESLPDLSALLPLSGCPQTSLSAFAMHFANTAP
jgi:hypothetical protein